MKSHGPPSPHIRSPQYSTAPGALLTNARILRYILAGHYGESARLRALANRPKPRQPSAKPRGIAAALNILNGKT